ncbi:MAG: type II toxin-antitoxin system Phd/YefM family antitoxin [Desertimonas sp.]
MAKMVNVHEAKTTLSQLLVDCEDGQEVIIARRGRPIARLVPITSVERAPWGSLTLPVPVDDAAFEPLGEDELRGWGLA